MSKFVRVIKNGEYTDYTPQDLIHSYTNKFAGWKCSAGSEGLFIDWEGKVWPATCVIPNEEHLLGSLNDDKPIKILTEYITCPLESCPCLIEIYLPKYKTSPNELTEVKEGNVTLEKFNAITRAQEYDRGRKYIMWAFGKKCNFSCFYCDDNSHSKLDSDLVTADAIEKALEYADQFRNGKPIMWSFTGGEPTINPLFLNLVKRLHSKGDSITVATNGSATDEYYSELAKYANINISVHFEFLKPEKLRRVSAAIISSKPDWFGMNFMIMPGKAETCAKYLTALSSIDNFEEKIIFHFDILRVKNKKEYYSYSQEDIDLIEQIKNFKNKSII